MASDQIVDLIRLSERELRELLERLDAPHTGAGGAKYSRNAVRWSLRQQRAVLTVVDDNAQHKSAVVVPRNLSTQGVGFLYGGYLHKEQRCNITLRARDGSPRSIPGTVLRCTHVKGHIHEIGVRLDHPIAPSDFLLQDPEVQQQELDAVDPAQLTGEAIIVSPNQEFTGATTSILADTSIRTTTSPDLSPLRNDSANGHNVVILDASAFKQSPEQAIRAIRAEGYAGVLFVYLPQQNNQLKTRLVLAGASAVFVHPPARQELIRSLAQHILRDNASFDLNGAPDAATGLKRLAVSAVELRSTATEQDIVAMIRIVESIAQQAEQLGVETIESLTEQCIQQLRANGISGAKQSIDQLAEKCDEAANADDDATTPPATAA